MMNLGNDLVVITAAIGGSFILIAIMALLIIWARRRSSGVIAIGAFMSVFAPDPTFEQKIKLVEEAKADQQEEDGQGEL
jgi:hypothetical protein